MPAGAWTSRTSLSCVPRRGNFAEALDWTAEVYRAAGALMEEAGTLQGVADEGGWWPAFSHQRGGDWKRWFAPSSTPAIEPGTEVAIALDVAASEFGRGGKYKLALEDKELDSEGMIKLLTSWVDATRSSRSRIRWPRTIMPASPPSPVRWAQRVQVIGDDLLVTQASRVREAAMRGAANAVLLKPNQRGTLTETHEAWQAAKDAGFAGIISARSGETEDVTIVHLAVGWAVGQLKVGSFARSERMAKWNEALRVEEALGARARFAGRIGAARTHLNVLFHYAAGPDLTARLSAIRNFTITICPDQEERLLAQLLPETDVLWHVLKRCTAEMIAAPHA